MSLWMTRRPCMYPSASQAALAILSESASGRERVR